MLILLEAWDAGGLKNELEVTKLRESREQPKNVVFLGHGKPVEARL